MVSEGYDGVDSPWNLFNAVQVNEPKNSIWTRVNLYLVEHDWRGEFGDPDTTLLFKGLEILCRFRSLFLERRSEFSSMACRVARVDDAKVSAGAMERELNLL